MAKNDNLKDFLVDLADTIREKKGISGPINPQDFAGEIAGIESGSGNGWTGHADAEGLRAIGWTDEDIAYYQENGVDWNEEDDHLHLVSDDNKALYGVLTADNISSYKDRIVYLPKIDTSKKSNIRSLCYGCYKLIAVPSLDLTNVTTLTAAFKDCVALVSISPIYAPKAVSLNEAFRNCVSLTSVSLNIPTENVDATYVFYRCASLLKVIFEVPLKPSTAVTSLFALCGNLKLAPIVDTSNVTNFSYMYYYCLSLHTIPFVDVSKAINMTSILNMCAGLSDINLSGVCNSFSAVDSIVWSKDSLLYAINNEAATSPITITLAANVYDKYATDPDVLEALANHPNITLASA